MKEKLDLSIRKITNFDDIKVWRDREGVLRVFNFKRKNPHISVFVLIPFSANPFANTLREKYVVDNELPNLSFNENDNNNNNSLPCHNRIEDNDEMNKGGGEED